MYFFGRVNMSSGPVRIPDSGWFADQDDDSPDDTLWRPYLQVGDDICAPLDIWFKTEADCWDFIEKEVIGKGFTIAERRLMAKEGRGAKSS